MKLDALYKDGTRRVNVLTEEKTERDANILELEGKIQGHLDAMDATVGELRCGGRVKLERTLVLNEEIDLRESFIPHIFVVKRLADDVFIMAAP